MNERIKELEQQAMTFRAGIQMLDTDKFAESIVQDIIKNIALDTANYPGEGMMAYYQGVQDAVKSVQKILA